MVGCERMSEDNIINGDYKHQALEAIFPHLLIGEHRHHARLALALSVSVRAVDESLVLRLRRRRDHRVHRVLRHEILSVAERRRHVVSHLGHRRVVRTAFGSLA